MTYKENLHVSKLFRGRLLSQPAKMALEKIHGSPIARRTPKLEPISRVNLHTGYRTSSVLGPSMYWFDIHG